MAGIIGGGKDRAWLEPLDEEGHIRSDDPDLDTMVGCHEGNYFGLNVVHPQEGCNYVWERNTRPDLLRIKTQGGEVVQAGDPELSAFASVETDRDTQMDSTNVYGDVVLVRYTEEAIRRKRDAENKKAQNMMRSGAKDFLDRATQAERDIAGGQATRFRRNDHRIDLQDDAGRTVDSWVPGDGIID